MTNRSGRLSGIHIAAVLAGIGAFIVTSIGGATIIGKSEPAESLTISRISALPTSQRGAWLTYFHRSEQQEKIDRAALAAERQGMKDVPPDPPLGPSARSMPLNREASWYSSPEARHIADVIVSFQTPSGGWGKNMNMDGAPRVQGESFVTDNSNRFPSPGDFDAARDPSWHYVGTIDNDATTTEMHFLAKVQAGIPHTDGEKYRASFLRGVQYLFAAQYPNGGWPQVWPLEGGYHDAITFNDDAVYNATQLLTEVSDGNPDEAFVPADIRKKAEISVAKSIECILAAQVELAGKKTVWAQQIDMLTLKPVAARNYEPAALSSEESSDLLMCLMRIPHPKTQERNAIIAGISWLRAHAIYGKAVIGGRNTSEGRHVVEQQGAGPLWARFYALNTQQPVFGDRDKTLHDDMNEISQERRNGYAWFNTEPAAAIKMYENWCANHGACPAGNEDHGAARSASR
ncbi:MAG TPA: pectate lyase [Acidobacteriaceae bacterium]|nr:pectate lyase [Acidobacteriaceae bacterium]